jgi:hypothetical protein
MKKEAVQLWWAAGGVLVMGFIASFGSLYRVYPPTTLLGFVLHATTLFIVGGFYLVMFAECVTRPRRHRAFWIAFLIVLPILSAYIYFMVTRSVYYLRSTHGSS